MSLSALIALVTVVGGAALPALPEASAATNTAAAASYESTVLADAPLAYYRFDEGSGTVADDSSVNGNDGTYVGVSLGAPGALLSATDSAVAATGRTTMFHQSGDELPGGNSARTVELWVDYVCCNGAIDLVRYGDVAGGHGFEVILGDNADTISVSADGNTVTANSLTGIRSGWHLIDVSFDGSVVEVYQDGQIVGGGAMGPISTTAVGQGLQLAGNATAMGADELALYGAALSPSRVDAHWSTGASSLGFGTCSTAPTAPYSQTVLGDQPLLYYRLDETASGPDSVAFDSSPHCANGAYLGSPTSAAGGLAGDADTAFTAADRLSALSQSGDTLPAGKGSRTFESWVKYVCCNGAIGLFRYGDIAGGHGFMVALGDNADSITVSDGGANSVTASTGGVDLRSGWHLLDVSYDGSTGTVEVYQDGQVIGGGVLDLGTGTVVPGQGMQMAANATGMGLDEVAVYGTALVPASIDTHWSAGAAAHADQPCAAAATSGYSAAVLTDAPTAYYRLDDLAADSHDRLALDSSTHCRNAAYSGTPTSVFGALLGDSDTATAGGDRQRVLMQSGDAFPAGNGARTFETWINYKCCNGAISLFRYGDVVGGNGFTVGLGDNADTVFVTDGATTVTAPTITGIRNGWHLLDVTFDGTTAKVYQDGQLIDAGTLGPINTAVPGQGMQMDDNALGMDLDEVAVYSTALSSGRINAHYEAQYLTPAGHSLIAGNVTFEGSNAPATGARVQACPTSGDACAVSPETVDSSGQFHVVVPDGSYTVTIFPPPGSASSPKVVGPLTVPPSVSDLHVQFITPGSLPAGTSFSTPSGTTTSGSVPSVNWGDPSTFTATGCHNGAGILYVHATNTSTGQQEVHAVDLVEQPAGSGTYVAQIPPLAPDHGQGALAPYITCPGQTSVVPDGGALAGGQHTLLFSNGGFTGAKAVSFGGTPAPSFQVADDKLINTVVPPGSGSVTVSVTTSTNAVVDVGTYNYFDVTSISPTSGPSSGGTTVTINGHGFGSGVRGVLFGLLPANSFTVVNPTEIQASAPIGIGAVNVQVINDLATSPATSSTRFTYTGGPTGSDQVVEPYGGGEPDLTSYANQVTAYCSTHDCASAGVIGVNQAAAEWNAPVSSSAAVPPPPEGVTKMDWFGLLTATAGGVAAIVCFTPPSAVACAIAGGVLAVVGLGQAVWSFLHDGGVCFKIGSWDVFSACPNANIDPSGTVVDTGGNPISGATATLLTQPGGNGSFVPVDQNSGAITPAVNPQTTGATGAFDWDAIAGAYQVSASASGCHAPGQPAVPDVSTPTFLIPPPKVGLLLTMDCGAASSPTPTVTGVIASTGSTDGGNSVDITGTGLVGATAVHFGSTLAQAIQVLSAYDVRVIAPARSGGVVDVTVTTPGGTTATSASDSYTYVAPTVNTNRPTVTEVTPNAGPQNGGTAVTIHGTNLSGATVVAFAGTPATSFTPVSATEVDAVAPASSFNGKVHVTVTAPSGTSATSAADTFFYGAPGALGAPAVTGAPIQGQQLSTSAVSWTGEPTSTHTSWQRCSASGTACAAISGATSSTYRLAAADVGHTVRAVASATNSVGTGTVASGPTARVWTVAVTAPSSLFGKSRAIAVRYGTTAGGHAASYDVQYRVAAWNGGFGAFHAPAAWQHTTATKHTLTGSAGHEYCFRVRVRDSGGHVSPWSADHCAVVPLDDRSLAGSGWSRVTGSAYYLHTASRASKLGTELSVKKAKVDRVALLVSTCPTCGKLAVLVNGKVIATVNTHSSRTRNQQLLVLPRLKLTTATISLRVTTAGKRVVVDGLGVSRT